MQGFRNLIKGWLGKTILFAVIVLFTLLGAEGLLSVLQRPEPPIVVNGEVISDVDIQRETELSRQRILQRMGENADPGSIDTARLREQAIDSLIQTEVMRQASEDQGLHASRLQVTQRITSIDAFQVEGEFSEELFERAARNFGYSSVGFFNKMGEEIKQMQYVAGLGASAFVSEAELKSLVAIQKEKRDIAHAVLNTESFKDSVTITDEDIENYYNDNSGRFLTQEMAKAEYVEIKVEDFLRDAEINEAEVRAEFDSKIALLGEAEERRSSHILAEITETQDDSDALSKINEVITRLGAGDDFATVAKELSDDIGSKDSGGDLDYASRGGFLPEYEDALFSLAVGELSPVIKTEYGYHVIKLTDIRTPELPDFADQQAQIEEDLKRAKAESIYYDRIEEIRTLAFESSDLIGAAEFLGKEVRVSDWVQRQGAIGLFSNSKMTTALFSEEVLLDNQNSDLIELDSGSAYVLRVKEHKPEVTKPLAEVKEQVREQLEATSLASKAEEAGKAVIAKLREGQASSTVLADYKDAVWITNEGAERRSPELNFQITQEAFKLAKPAADERTVGGVKTPNGYAVIIVSKVEPGAFDLSDNEAAQMKQYLANQLGQADLNSFIELKKQAADIEIN